MSVNSNNFKFMSLLKNYFNLTYDPKNYTAAENNLINSNLFSGIYTVLPKITKLKLNQNCTFVYKYCNNCYYLNNSVYTKPETVEIAPSTIIKGNTSYMYRNDLNTINNNTDESANVRN